MKRNDVYGAFINYAREAAKKVPNFNNEKIMNASVKRGHNKNAEVVDSKFKGIYKSYKVNKIEVGILLGIIVVSLFIPVKLIYRPLIGLVTCVVVEFFRTKGHKFLASDLNNKFNYKDDVKLFYKPKIGDFTPVFIGVNKNEIIEVHDLRNDEDFDHLEDGIYQYADKETLGYFLSKYIHGDKTCVDSVSREIKNNLLSDYASIEHMANNQPNKLNSFHKK